MRRVLTLAALALAACRSEPSFNEAYDAQSEALGAQANAIEAELGRQLDASVRAGGLPGNPDAPDPRANEAAAR